VVGIFYLFKNHSKKIFLLIFAVSYPVLFIYPTFNINLLLITLPFFALIISFGLTNVSKKYSLAILIICFIEISLNLTTNSYYFKVVNDIRPNWIQPIASRVFNLSQDKETYLSDDLSIDTMPLVGWYGSFNKGSFALIDWPYKYRQTEIDNLKLIGADFSFRTCSAGEMVNLILSDRDMKKIDQLKFKKTLVFKDNLDKDRAFEIEGVCLEN